MVLWWHGRQDAHEGKAAGGLVAHELASMGPMSRHERVVLGVFGAAAALWIASNGVKPWVQLLLPTLWDGFVFQGKHYEALVAMAAAFSLVALRAVSFRSLRKVPWDTLLLLGGSFAMAAGLEGSGFSSWMSDRLTVLQDWSPGQQILATSAATVFLSALASNTATINVMISVLPHDLRLLFVGTLAASCDFALPAGTPPNAIVIGSGQVRLPVMMRLVAVLDGASVLLLTAYALAYLSQVLPG
jgi:sodium-dependent dicarboxylate transporter 2/3/5